MNSTRERVTCANVDLSNCDREQIQYSNAVQPHAVLAVIDPESLRVLQVSRNAEQLAGRSIEELVGQNIDQLLGESHAAQFAALLPKIPQAAAPQFLFHATFPGGARDLFAHRVDSGIILELERASEPSNGEASLYSRIQAGITQLHAINSVAEFLDRAVRLIAEISGFERVMAYRFMPDGSGEVVAEAVLPGLERYLGLHYPASDIPQPARRLFSLTWLRHLPNVDYVPVPIVPAENPLIQDTVDLSYAFSRSVSVMYTDYLRNMGVKATMVLTLMKSGTLWGLISCMNHSRSHHLRHEKRAACELLGHVVSLLMAAKEDVEIAEYKQKLRHDLSTFLDRIQPQTTVGEALTQGPPHLLSTMDAAGAAVLYNGEIRLLGKTPSPTVVRAIADELPKRMVDGVWSTDNFSLASNLGKEVSETASGVLGVQLGRYRSGCILWFRPEYLQTVKWAGDPTNPVEVDRSNGAVRLRPRGSFAVWSAEVRYRSAPWKQCEIDFAVDLARGVVGMLVERTRELNILNADLAQSNRELDEFVYAASHDLKEPLRGIHNYAQFLQRTLGDRLTAIEGNRLNSIVQLAQRVDNLIDGLLDYSRAGHRELALEMVELDQVIEQATAMLQVRLEESGAVVKVPRKLPALRCDPLQVQQLFFNLISNALKYNNKNERWVEIGWLDDGPTFYVRDNGIGIAREDWDSIFKIFRRLHRRDAYGGGTGAGLTIARRTVERHGGRMWLESEVGAGTTFYFTLTGEGNES